MTTYLVKRILGVIPVFFGVCFVAFAIIALFPGDFYSMTEVGYLMEGMSRGEAANATAALLAAAGADKHWIVQYWVWMSGVITEWEFKIPWHDVLRPESGLGWTLVIAGSSMIWGWLLGLLAGVIAGARKNSWIDRLLNATAYIGYSFPSYVWGTLFFVFVYTFINTHVRGAGIWGPVGYELIGKPLTLYKVGSHILHLIPAWIIVAAPIYATVMRHMRAGIAEALTEPYVNVVRAKGVRERRVIWKHAFRNALNQLVSIFGMTLPRVITAMILVAPILGFPTFGKYMLDKLLYNSRLSVMGCLLIYAALLYTGNLVADILLCVIDPRIRYD